MTKRASIQSTLGIVLFLAVPGLPLSRWENEFSGGVGHLLGYEAIWWAVLALLFFYVRVAEDRPLSSIGFRRLRFWDLPIGVAAGIVALCGIAGIYYLVFPALHLDEGRQVNQLLATPLWWRFISVVRAAIGEEALFRGYAIERGEELTGRLSPICVLSWAVFTLEHVGTWGWPHLILAGFGGLVLTLLYVWRRNLWTNILAHFIVDGAAVLFG
jgi:uncharacterized protein